MRILVIGSEGNIGCRLVEHLRSRGHQVLRSDIIQHFASDYVQTDVVSMLDLYREVVSFSPEVVYHLAAMVSRVTCEAAPHLTIDTNLSGTNNVAQMCRLVGAKMVNFSTSEVYGDQRGPLSETETVPKPNNRYGLSKYLAEQLVRYEVENHGLDAVSVRPFMYYDEDETLGDHRSAMIRFAEALTRGETISVHRNSRRGWLHIDDAVVALERLTRLDGFHTLNIGHPEVVETESIARYFCERLDLLYDEHVEEVDLPDRMTLEKVPDLRLQKELLDFEPTISIQAGMDRVLTKVRTRLSFEMRTHDVYGEDGG